MTRLIGSLIGLVSVGLFPPALGQSIRQGATAPSVTAQEPKTPRKIAQEAFPSVAILVMQDSHGQPTTLGSGFVIGGGLVVTNRHVIAGATSGYGRIVGGSTKYVINGTMAVDEAHDLAILSVNGLKAPALPIDDSAEVAVGDVVYAVGNPQGLEGTFSQGIVSAIRPVEGSTLLQITSPISPGSSGGPILNSRGQVIGIAVATFTGGQNLNLAIPSSYLTALVERISGKVLPISDPHAAGEKRTIISHLGGPNVEGVVGENLTWTLPDNEYYGDFAFSLRNRLQQPIKNISYLVIFFGRDNSPIDFTEGSYTFPIPGGLAKRVFSRTSGDVNKLVHAGGHAEIRILDFRLAE